MSRRLSVVRASALHRREVVMLLPDLNLPLGCVSVLCGQQGIGKGTISTRWAADVTHTGHGVIFLAEEDSAEAVIKPRLEAAGADLDHVHIVRGERMEDGGALLPRDTEELAEIATETASRLLIIDPWTNHVDVPSLDRGQVRQALMPLARIADECMLCALLNAHPVKYAGAGDPLSEIAHASAVSQVARAAFWVTLDPDGGSDDPDVNRLRLVSAIKANLSRFGRTQRYELADTYLPANDLEPAVNTVRAIHRGASSLSYRDVRRQERNQGSTTKAERAREWLNRFLTAEWMKKQDVVAAGEAAGHSARSIERAADALSVERHAIVPGPIFWRSAGSPSGSPVPNVGEPGEPQEESHIEQTPAREGHGSPGSPGSPAGDSWRTVDDPPLDGQIPGQTNIYEMTGEPEPPRYIPKASDPE